MATKKMKTFILVACLMLFCPMGLFAQQFITFKSGFSCRAVVVDKSGDTLRYQPLSDPDVTLSAPMWMVESITEAGALIPGKGKVYWEKRLTKYTRMSIAGGTILGLGAIGTAVAVSALNHNDYYDGSETATGVGLFVLSTACVISGSLFTIIGGINVGVSKKELRKFKVEIMPNPAISGATVRIKF